MTINSKIMLPTIADVKSFINVMNGCVSDDVVLKSGRYVVNAKSLMGIFSLDLDMPVEIEFPVEVHTFIRDNILERWGIIECDACKVHK